MIETQTYKGTEFDLDELMIRLNLSKIEVNQLQSKPTNNPENDVRGEDIYLVDSIAMKVKIVAAQSAMAVNDDVYISLVGEEKTKVSDIEEMVQLYFKPQKN